MKDNRNVMNHLILVLRDKLKIIEEDVNNYEIIEVLSELDSFRINVNDLFREVDKYLDKK